MMRLGVISRNSLAAWGRSILALTLGFFASRWLLSAIGVEVYGLWVLVCGMVSMATVAHAVLASATSRFMAVAVGRGDVAEWYAVAVKAHIAMAVVSVCVGFPVCAWLLGRSVSAERAAEVFSVMAMLFAKAFAVMVNAPNRQLFVAHQRLVEPSLWSCADLIVNFAVLAWMVVRPGCGLLFYAAVLSVSAFFIEGGLWLRSTMVFGSIKVHGVGTRAQIAEVFRFAGWRFFSDGGSMLGTQGLTVLLSSRLGPVFAASAGVARTVGNHCGSLAEAVAQAYEPALANVVGRSGNVVSMAARACGRLVAAYLVFAVPLAMLVNPVLQFWLKDVPPQASAAVLWVLATGALDAVGRSFYSAVTATGRVCGLYVGVGLLHGLALPLAAALWMAFPRYGISMFFAAAFIAHLFSLLWTMLAFWRVVVRRQGERPE